MFALCLRGPSEVVVVLRDMDVEVLSGMASGGGGARAMGGG